MPAELETAFDAAIWFADQALNENEYLQPQKLHRLLFLAQGYYAVAYGGRKLMPAMFIADEMGPSEPNIYKAFSKGRPDVATALFVPYEAESFLRNIWGRFGHLSTDRLTRMTKRTMAYRQAFKRGNRAEIYLDTMRLSFIRADESPQVDRVVKPKLMVTQSGKAVTVKSWVPGGKPGKGRQ